MKDKLVVFLRGYLLGSSAPKAVLDALEELEGELQAKPSIEDAVAQENANAACSVLETPKAMRFSRDLGIPKFSNFLLDGVSISRYGTKNESDEPENSNYAGQRIEGGMDDSDFGDVRDRIAKGQGMRSIASDYGVTVEEITTWYNLKVSELPV